MNKEKKFVSLKDIARKLGVSVPTVSRALRNSHEISPEMCHKVQQMAKEMNYRPNPFAMSLRHGAPRTIGIILPDIVPYFYASILRGIQEKAVENGYFVIVTSSDEKYENELRNLESLYNMRVEGIIACLTQETTDYSHFHHMKEAEMPLVLFDRVCLTDEFSSVIADGAVSAKKATLHLLDSGCKRIAFLGGDNHLDIVKQRKHGYLEALRERGISIDRQLIECRKFEFNAGCEATEQLLALPVPPDAILAANDTVAFAAMEVIRRHKLRIPDDISIIGYTDENHANYLTPKLTSVCHQTFEMGQQTCALLLEQIKGVESVRQVVVPTILQVRDSTR